MAHSKTTIVNSAIVKLGDLAVISVDDGTRAADLAKLRFDDAVDAVLEMHNWKDAIKTVSLSQNATSPADPSYDNSFDLPTDYLKRILLLDESGTQVSDYSREGRTILTNRDALIVKYIARITDFSFISTYLAESISWWLANEIATPLIQSDRWEEKLTRLFERHLRRAKTIDSREGHQKRFNANDLVNARRDFTSTRDVGSLRFPHD